jgi:hypothetical protein
MDNNQQDGTPAVPSPSINLSTQDGIGSLMDWTGSLAPVLVLKIKMQEQFQLITLHHKKMVLQQQDTEIKLATVTVTSKGELC